MKPSLQLVNGRHDKARTTVKTTSQAVAVANLKQLHHQNAMPLDTSSEDAPTHKLCIPVYKL